MDSTSTRSCFIKNLITKGHLIHSYVSDASTISTLLIQSPTLWFFPASSGFNPHSSHCAEEECLGVGIRMSLDCLCGGKDVWAGRQELEGVRL